ncbi:hypothetical protein LCGC14_1364750 [marine sediment metagenome]|uniref:Uncharacterized protein n=1 Tax=marine sediment metagenome TaxID=412755 RepID=A0A0F9KT75_9ZZZZ
MTADKQIVSNEILLDRAITSNFATFLQIKDLVNRAIQNDTKRTTITLATLDKLIDGIAFVNDTLHQTKL